MTMAMPENDDEKLFTPEVCLQMIKMAAMSSGQIMTLIAMGYLLRFPSWFIYVSWNALVLNAVVAVGLALLLLMEKKHTTKKGYHDETQS